MLANLSVDQALLKAKSHLKKNQIAEAQKLYKAVLLAFPKNTRAQLGLDSLKNSNNNKLLKSSINETTNQLINFYNQGKFLEVIEKAKNVINQYPKEFKVWNILGASKYQIGMLDQAVEAYKNCISLKSDYAEAYSNLGNALTDQGKIEEAIKVYNKAIWLKPKLVEASISLGNALKYLGKHDLAIEAYRKALVLKPNHAIAHNNLANTLKDQGKIDEAIEEYKISISIKSDYAEAYNNLGNAYADQGKLDEALKTYEKSVILKSDYPEVYNNIGVVYKKQGEINKSIESFIKSISQNYNYQEAYSNFGEALMGVTFKEFNTNVQNSIISLLDQKKVVRPRTIAKAIISLLKLEPTLQSYLHNNFIDELNQPLQSIIKDLSKLDLFLKFISICPVDDIEIEYLLKNIRSRILLSDPPLICTPEVLKFQSALALQCFCNEYIYNQSKEEETILEELENQVKNTLNNNEQDNKSILCLASYKPLNHFKWLDKLYINSEIQEVFVSQVEEPKQEKILKSEFITLKEIKNDVSSKVREQYEVNPYPKWVNLALTLRPYEISKWVNDINLKLFDNTIKEIKMPDILIAGCGTGQHSLETAARFKNSKVTAIDLSLSSLAYAERKTKEYGLKNIEYMQADILDLSNLNQQFDIIESIGVLHHMKNPFEGWKVLTNCLKPGGLMRIGLYSEMARKHIIKIREEILEAGIDTSETDMKSFRTKLINSEKKHHKEILKFTDFYSLSELRDLLFHIQEHRYTLPQIQETLSRLNLKFCGFDNKNIVSNFKLSQSNINDCYELEKWDIYEQANHNVFSGMYQFWCQKIS